MSKGKIDMHIDFIDEIELNIPKEIVKEKLRDLLEHIFAKKNIEIYSKYIQTSSIEKLKKRAKLKEEIVKSEIKKVDNKLVLVSTISRKHYFKEVYIEDGGYIETALKEDIDTDTVSISQYTDDIKISEDKTIIAIFYNIERVNVIDIRVILELIIFSPGIEENRRKIYFSK